MMLIVKTSLLVLLLIVCSSVYAEQHNVDEIVLRRDALMRGRSSYGSYEMSVKSKRWERTISFDAWSEGTEKSFITINYPKKDKGSTFLRIKTDMWQYVPKIEKTIKIPPSMMLQSWMGSDFTNDDLVKESSIVNDYRHKLLSDEEGVYVIESTPRPEAAVVWGKIIQWVDKDKYYPLKDEFYDEDGLLVRRFLYQDIQKINDRYYPMRWTVEPLNLDKKDNLTVVTVKSLELDIDIPDNVFTMRALKRYSR